MSLTLKRVFDFVMAASGLIALSPVLALIALAIRVDSPGSVFFRQQRIGQYGKPFRIHKFRSMHTDRPGGLLTTAADARVTRIGQIIRRFKLDELPQLFDVLRGEMSLVGPRPEVARFVDEYPPHARAVIFSVRPGITDRASIEFRNENDLLEDSIDPERLYIEEILPRKIDLYMEYVKNRSFFGDIKIILMTLRVIRAAESGQATLDSCLRSADANSTPDAA